jgi:hypothetical protein
MAAGDSEMSRFINATSSSTWLVIEAQMRDNTRRYVMRNITCGPENAGL